MSACGFDRPKGIYGSRKMQEVLYDYHLAQALADQRHDSVNFYRNYYAQAVFDKHHTTQAAFDSSMLWYMQNTEELYKVYDRLDDRLSGETQSGRAIIKREKNLAAGANTDTFNIWQLPENQLLSTSLGGNRFHFSLITDSLFSANDQLVWNFTTHWAYKDGRKQATAMLVVIYEGDSIVTRQHSLYRDVTEAISIKIDDRSVKAVKGFIYQSTTWSEKIRLLSINDISLLCIHKRTASDSIKANPRKADSLKTKTVLSDSAKVALPDSTKADSLSSL